MVGSRYREKANRIRADWASEKEMGAVRKKNDESHTTEEPPRKKAKKSSSAKIEKPGTPKKMSGLKKEKEKEKKKSSSTPQSRTEKGVLRMNKKKKVSIKEKEPAIKKTKKRSLTRIELQEHPLERKENVSQTDKEPARKKKKKSLLTKIILRETSSDISELRGKKKKLSIIGKESAIKKTKKSSLAQTEGLESHVKMSGIRKKKEGSNTGKELAKKKKKKKILLKKIELRETSSGTCELSRQKKKLSNTCRESNIKKTKKSSLAQTELTESNGEVRGVRKEEEVSHPDKKPMKRKKKKSSLTEIEPETSSDVSGLRKKKKLYHLGKKPIIQKATTSSLAQTELRESPVELGAVRKKEKVFHTDKTPAKKKKRKSLTKIEPLETSSDISERRKKNQTDKKRAIKKTKKSSLAQTEMQESPAEMSRVRKKKEASHTDKESAETKKKKSPLTIFELPETSSDICEPSKKKKLSQTDKELAIEKFSLAQTEAQEAYAEMNGVRKEEEVSHTDKELAKKNSLAKIEMPETSSDIREPRRKKKKLSNIDKEPTIKKTKKSSLAKPERQESPVEMIVREEEEVSHTDKEQAEKKKKKSPLTNIEQSETSLDISGLRKDYSNTEEIEGPSKLPEELPTEMDGLRKEMEVLQSDEEEPLEPPQKVEVTSPANADSPQKIMIIPDSWSQAVASIAYDSVTSPGTITVVCGAKNSGKTTFCRFLLNNIIQRYGKVAYLETDVGQAEFTPPGCLSLSFLDKQIPAFADLTDQCFEMPERCFFFGDISSKRDPNAYLNNVISLYDHFRAEYHMFKEIESPRKTQLPLVVNTPGWVKGIGYDILVEMLKCIAPTHVVQIRIPIECKNLPAGPFWLNGDHEGPVNLIEIGAVHHDHSGKWMLRRKDSKFMRDRRIFLYFRQCFPSDLNITSWKDLAHALASHPPYEVSLSSVKVRHLHCQVPSSEVLRSLNATIVGLAVSSVKCRDSEPCTPWCVGLGIVRGVDISKDLLYVLTPVPPSNLKNVDLLLQGFVQIPTYLLQVQGCRSPYMSEHVLTT